MSSWAPTTYKTRNWAEYNLPLNKRVSLSIGFDAGMVWDAAPSGRRGRQQAYSDAAMQACLTLKVLFGLPLRQTTGFVASLLKLGGLDWSGLFQTSALYVAVRRRFQSLFPTRVHPDRCTCLSTARGSKLKGTASGTPASMVVPNVACGARYISG